jgi:DNA-3-methyladenine glycosylase II
MPKLKPATNWSAAVRHLRKVDPDFRKVIDQVGPCRITPGKGVFTALCIAIFNQQVSGAAAKSMYGKFCAVFPRKKPTPKAALPFLKGPDDAVRACGISRQKRGYLIDLAEHFVDGRIPVRKLPRMDDEAIIEALTAVKGIGRWSAEMFLIFVLNRPDVWPVDDMGVQEGYRRLKGLKHRPKPKELAPLGDVYQPYRTVAAWYCWRALEASRTAQRKP